MLWSLTQMSLQGNGLPRWPLGNSDTGVMLGTSVNIIIPEALQKGLTGFNETEWIQLTTDAMMGRTDLSYGAPPDVTTFTELGYYPEDEVWRSVAWTQEQAIADHALGTYLVRVGNTMDGETLIERGHNWSNLWDPQTGFIHGRLKDGSFGEFISEDQWDEDYAEGNARQYLWLAPHDYQRLFSTLGGQEESLRRLTSFFNNMVTDEILPGLPERYYWHGNEPTLHVPYFFYLLDDPEAGDYWIEWILNNRYDDGPVGLAGNDDGGALSAWATFAMMGFYPIAGTTEYVLGSPVWDRVEIHTEDNPIVLDVDSESAINVVNGSQWSLPLISHENLNHITFGTR